MAQTHNNGGSAMTQPKFTKTETLRRLRVLSKKMRAYGLIPAGGSLEVGYRTRPVTLSEWNFDDPEQHSKAWSDDDDDDLDYHDMFVEAAKHGLEHGLIVHVYVTDSMGCWGGQWDLCGTHMGWLGTPDAEPLLINIDGMNIDPTREPRG